MTTPQTIIPDGDYAILPDGGCWIAVRIRGGRMVGMTEQSNAETHIRAGDRWAATCEAIADSETDEHTPADVAAAVLAAHGGGLLADSCCVELVDPGRHSV